MFQQKFQEVILVQTLSKHFFNLNNPIAISAIQFDIDYPEGFSINLNLYKSLTELKIIILLLSKLDKGYTGLLFTVNPII